VTWHTRQEETEGKIVKKQTSATKIKGHDVRASTSNPAFIAESQVWKEGGLDPGGLTEAEYGSACWCEQMREWRANWSYR
jgi:hypothetical protein